MGFFYFGAEGEAVGEPDLAGGATVIVIAEAPIKERGREEVRH